MAGGIPEVRLSSGHAMPVIGFGTAAVSPPPVEVFLDAIEVGYRHFDTASLYGSEQTLGLAIAEALRRGLITSRDELFVTSKLWCTDAHPDLVLPALKKSLKNLGLEYLDLYLIHWPVRLKKKDNTYSFKEGEEQLPFEIIPTWKAMEECQKLGLVKSIGVSNFSSKKLSELLAHAAIPPAVNQVEMNTSWNQHKLREFSKDKGVHITAWSPLGANGAIWGSLNVMQSPVLKEIASNRGKTVANVALRWLYEQGVSIVVKSYNKERMKENLQIFDWELTQEELKKISEIPQCKGLPGDQFVSPNGPYKSLEELWDGEI